MGWSTQVYDGDGNPLNSADRSADSAPDMRTCPGCGHVVYLSPLDGWRNDTDGYTCTSDGRTHNQNILASDSRVGVLVKSFVAGFTDGNGQQIDGGEEFRLAAINLLRNVENAGLVVLEPEKLATALHQAWEHQYDECDHGTYTGGANHGEPYAMCKILARSALIRLRGEQ